MAVCPSGPACDPAFRPLTQRPPARRCPVSGGAQAPSGLPARHPALGADR